MSNTHEEIDKYILRRYDFVQKLGKGVRPVLAFRSLFGRKNRH
jgi:hypothetical protein